MKNKNGTVMLLICVVLFLNSCSVFKNSVIEKRHYRSGFFVSNVFGKSVANNVAEESQELNAFNVSNNSEIREKVIPVGVIEKINLPKQILYSVPLKMKSSTSSLKTKLFDNHKRNKSVVNFSTAHYKKASTDSFVANNFDKGVAKKTAGLILFLLAGVLIGIGFFSLLLFLFPIMSSAIATIVAIILTIPALVILLAIIILIGKPRFS